MSPASVLELHDVTFRRGGTHILEGIDLTVRAGEHWALLGPNGAGKSTVLGFCGALSFPTSGTVDVLGRRLGRVELQELRRHIGHVNPRHPVRSPLTVTEVVLTGLTGIAGAADALGGDGGGAASRARPHPLGRAWTTGPMPAGRRCRRASAGARSSPVR